MRDFFGFVIDIGLMLLLSRYFINYMVSKDWISSWRDLDIIGSLMVLCAVSTVVNGVITLLSWGIKSLT